MNVSLISDQDPIQVALSGKVIQRNVSPFSDPVKDAIGDDAFAQQVLLDMSGVEMFDSSGVSWLLRCHKQFKQTGGTLIVHSVSPIVQDVIRLLKIDQVLFIASDLEDGVRLLKEKTA